MRSPVFRGFLAGFAVAAIASYAPLAKASPDGGAEAGGDAEPSRGEVSTNPAYFTESDDQHTFANLLYTPGAEELIDAGAYTLEVQVDDGESFTVPEKGGGEVKLLTLTAACDGAVAGRSTDGATYGLAEGEHRIQIVEHAGETGLVASVATVGATAECKHPGSRVYISINNGNMIDMPTECDCCSVGPSPERAGGAMGAFAALVGLMGLAAWGRRAARRAGA